MKRYNNGYYIGPDGRYQVRIYENGKRKYLGTYDTEKEAVDIYRKACEEKLIRSVEKFGHSIEDGILYKDNYVVFDNGDIFSITGGIIHPHPNRFGYLRCHINDGEETIHRIIAKCFVPNVLDKPCVNHINGIKTDNRAVNLEWCTYSENSHHAYNNRLRIGPRGENNGRSKLTYDDVNYIRRNYIPRNPEYNMPALAEKFGVHKNTIYDVLHTKKWNRMEESED